MKIENFITLLEKAKAIKELEAVLNRYLSSFGFSSYAFTYYAQHVKSGSKLQYEFASKALKPWHEHYIKNNYADSDRTLDADYHRGLPEFWDIELQLKQAKSLREQQIRSESLEFGLRKGLSIPMYGPNGDFVSLTLHQRVGETNLEHYQSQQYEWTLAAYYYYFYVKKIILLEQQSTKIHLTRREKQCLNLTSRDWSVEQIAAELKISLRTVHFHIQNANRKLGVRNKYHAVLKWQK